MAQDKTKQLELKIEKLESKIDKLYEIVGIYDKSLSSISGLLTLMPNDEDHISSWQAKGAFNCMLATCQTYAELGQKELEAINE